MDGSFSDTQNIVYGNESSESITITDLFSIIAGINLDITINSNDSEIYLLTLVVI